MCQASCGAVHPPIFGLPSDAFFRKHLLLLSTLRGLLSANAIQPHLLVFLRQLQQHAAAQWAAAGDPAEVPVSKGFDGLLPV